MTGIPSTPSLPAVALVAILAAGCSDQVDPTAPLRGTMELANVQTPDASATRSPRTAFSGGEFFGSAPPWDDVTGVLALGDNSVASEVFPVSFATFLGEVVHATNFGFEIPHNVTITGIQARVAKRQKAILWVGGVQLPENDPDRVFDNNVRLKKNGVAGGSDQKLGVTWPNDEFEYVTYGGNTDLWGRSWTPADINAADFGLAVQANAEAHLSLTRYAEIDHISITVFYTSEPGADAGPDFIVARLGTSASATLDGTGSTNPGNAPLTYTWTGAFVGGTATGATPTVVFTSPGDHVVTLQVTDGNFTDTDAVTVTVIKDAAPQTRNAGAAVNGPSFSGSFEWSNLTGVFSQGGGSASAGKFDHLFGTGLTQDLQATRFGFQIPNDATITGIQLEVRRRQFGENLFGFVTVSSASDHDVRLMKNFSIGGSDKKKADSWPNSLAHESYGGATDLWGRAWTPADINNDAFGVALQAAVKPPGFGVNVYLQVDHIRIKVFYAVTVNNPPTADAGDDQTQMLTGANVSVTLDGNGSSDPDGDDLTYRWSGGFVGGTATGPTPTLRFTTLGEHVVTLQVSDGEFSATDAMTVTVRDGTPPMVGVAVSAPDGEKGWYRSNVTVTWTTTELQTPGSLVLVGCENRAISTDQPMTTYSCQATSAGGSSQPVTVTIGRDATPPLVAGILSPAANANGWHNTNVTITWNCSDALSGVAAAGLPQTVTSEGAAQTRNGSCADEAGNTAEGTVSGMNIDKTPPTMTGNRTPSANARGWNNVDVTVAWACTDALSGVANVTENQVVSGEGAGQSAQGLCADRAGNTDSRRVFGMNIDKTPPTMIGTRLPAANGNGWNNANVTVTWVCTDALAGILQTSNTGGVISTEGAGQSRLGQCIDDADNITLTSVDGINIDKTAPTLIGLRTPAANALGWNNTDVTVAWACTDALSGVANVTENQVVSGEGAAQSAQGLCADRAGNTGSRTVADINIDKTPPKMTGSRTPAANANGWNNVNVTVAWACTDALSGVANVTQNQVVSGEGAGQSAQGLCADRAGNTDIRTVADINIDRTAPSVTGTPSRAPDRNGWYRMPLGVAWSGNDALSGVASCAPAANYSGPDGANVGVGGTCRDRADNEGAGAFGFKYDATSPVITFTGNQGSYTVGLTVRIACSATDATSGIDAGSTTCPEIDAPAYTFALGSHTLEATATDMAGNVRAESSTFTVEVTYQSLGNLVDRFVSNGGVANSLDQKLVAASNAPTPGARAGQLRAFVQHLEAVRGRWLTSEHTDVLIRLAGGL